MSATMEVIEAHAERFLFLSDDGDFGVLRAKLGSGAAAESFTIAGAVGNAVEGLQLSARGEWRTHPKFGRQFQATGVKTREPDNVRGIQTYLSSDLISGIGAIYAARIVKHFGADTLRIIKETPERLNEVEGIGAKRAEKLAQSVHIQVAIEGIAVWLFDHGIGKNITMRIYRKYGLGAVEVLEENPYTLADEMFGVGFVTADGIARALGISKDDPRRLMAGLEWLIKQNENNGHTATLVGELYGRAQKLLGDSDFEPTLNRLDAVGRIKFMPSGIYRAQVAQSSRMHFLEKGIGYLIGKEHSSIDAAHIDAKALDRAQSQSGLKLDESQYEAAQSLLNAPISILTGRPGTGKTATLKVVLQAFEDNDVLPLLASPTGKAARRMTQATGRPASTIHRLLGFTPGQGFAHNRDNRLLCDALIVDESSMLDTYLMHSVLEALPDNARLILVGDIDQLPSVGPGRVLGDLIDSTAVKVCRLKTIHRQAKGSAIVTNAHAVIEGHRDGIQDGGDFRYIDFGPGATITERLGGMILNKLAPKLGVSNVIDDIQVLTPTHKGPLGTKALNEALQAAFNPNPAKSHTHRGTQFSTGDKVIVTRNNYDLGVFNGTLGRITDVITQIGDSGRTEHGLIVAAETGESVLFIGSDMDDLSPGWALTVHKSQGSEFPVVVLVMDTSQNIMLERNWLYTGITRAENYCLVIGPEKAFSRAISKVRSERRQTLLPERIAF